MVDDPEPPGVTVSEKANYKVRIRVRVKDRVSVRVPVREGQV